MAKIIKQAKAKKTFKVNDVVCWVIDGGRRYGNIVKIDGIETQDVKIYKSKNKLVKNETGLISTETNSFQSLKNKIFKNNFYLSSSYEDSKYVDF